MASRRATCSRGPPRRSSRSSARGGCAGRRGRWSGGWRSSSRASTAILGLAALFLAGSPPAWVRGAAAGAGAAVAAVAVRTGWTLLAAARARADDGAGRAPLGVPVRGRGRGGHRGPVAGRGAARVRRGGDALEAGGPPRGARTRPRVLRRCGPRLVPAIGGVAALAWVALKVGALSYGGGFVIVPLMQHDAVSHYHWMTAGQFLDAVALGQVTPGPLVQTVAVVGYAAAGVGGGLLAAGVAFAPSFLFVLGGARHFDRLRSSAYARGFLGRRGPGGDRRDPRLGGAAGVGALRAVAGGGAGGRGRPAAGGAAGRGRDAALRGRGGRGARPGGGAAAAVSRQPTAGAGGTGRRRAGPRWGAACRPRRLAPVRAARRERRLTPPAKATALRRARRRAA